jgi:hypothetical protein
MQTYRVGQIWRREGKEREIVGMQFNYRDINEANENDGLFSLTWKRPGSDVMGGKPCSWTWITWARKAELVSEGANQ